MIQLSDPEVLVGASLHFAGYEWALSSVIGAENLLNLPVLAEYPTSGPLLSCHSGFSTFLKWAGVSAVLALVILGGTRQGWQR